MPKQVVNISELRRKLFFEVCDTQEELQSWLQTFLNLDFPDCTVDEESTSNPMQFVWECYNFMRTNKGPPEHVVAAGRGLSKTLGASAVEFLGLVHFRRQEVHFSALKAQSKLALKYLHKFCRIPELVGHFESKSAFEITLVKLPPNKFTSKPDAFIAVVAATIEATNGYRSNCIAATQQILALPPLSSQRKVQKTAGKWHRYSAEGIWKKFQKGEVIEVATINENTLHIEAKPVLYASRKVNLEQVKVTTESGHSFCVTNDHPIATSINDNHTITYTALNKLSLGDPILLKNLSPDAITSGRLLNTLTYEKITEIAPYSVAPSARARWVYDFHVQDNHNFFCVRGLVHNCNVGDEIDLTNRDVISEASLMGIPTSDEHSFDPLTIYLSSRKTNDGPLQDRMDEAEKSPEDIRVHKISWVDWMQKCEPTTHGAFGPTVFINRENLQVHWDALPKSVSTVDQTQFMERKVYEGCRTCPALLVCQGRAPNQTSTSKYLKSIQFVGRELKKITDVNKIIGQILNYKPESSGIVFNTFARHRHVGDLRQAYTFITAQDWQGDVLPTKQDLYSVAKRDGWKCLVGIDWGTRDPAIALTALYHAGAKRVLFLSLMYATGFANHLWAQYYLDNDATLYPPDLIAPDMADASSASYFSKSDFRVKSKKPQRIETGVSQINGLMFNPADQSCNLMVLDTPDLQYMIEAFSKWRYKTDGQGRFVINSFDTDGEFSHGLDSCRYLLDAYVKTPVAITSGLSTTPPPPQPEQASQIPTVGSTVQKHLIASGVHPSAFDQAALFNQLKNSGLQHLVQEYTLPEPQKKKGRFKIY